MSTRLSRRAVREYVFKMLYFRDFYREEEYALQQRNFAEAEELDSPEREEIIEKAGKICEAVPELDAMIDAVSENWRTGRMGKVELAILRLALYEIRREEEVPVKVSINEAVELAKLYGDESSPAFVNGILRDCLEKLEEAQTDGTRDLPGGADQRLH